ncbi:alpha-1,2-fucosyltransferase [Kiritimatiellaeota bacterium B1221]|nr:alpha-1,2-fucosyltransferase [Kiritimatiellaeota bacterium B1221]
MTKLKLMLCGGLGNQLFEYAFARALSLRCGLPLELDAVTMFKQDKMYKRHYELDAFILSDDVQICRHPQKFHRIERKIQCQLDRYRSENHRRYLQEVRPFRYQKELLTWKPETAVKILGYWQCESYFSDYASEVKNELGFKSPPLSTNWARKISGNDHAVMVHIRRVQYSRCVEKVYYHEAMKRMRETYPGCQFFCFSDDVSWAKEFLQDQEDCVVVDQEKGSAIEDLKLMTCCRHFIIANSSFSWWAAWLGEKQDSLVFAPPVSLWDNPEIIPSSWIQINN